MTARQLLFDEHEVFEKDELLVDQDVSYEDLEGYLKLS